jgi:lipopolysaccharide/colanic/teichoic acid biosynthesis glycosyltransferase
VATRIGHIREATFIPGLSVPSADEFYLLSKRVVDIVLAAVLLIVLLPLFPIIAVAIALDSPGPVIFRQKRVVGGQSLEGDVPEEHVFEFFKFRSMCHNADQTLHRKYMEGLIHGTAQKQSVASGELFKLGHDPRVTRVGSFLRRTSLDELPQLVNILRGDMSFVGPRPAIPYEVRQYKPWHMHRLTVTQGLTGLWQVMGRSELSFDEMAQLDIEYVRSRSLWLDIRILLATIPAVLGCRGVC